MLPFFIKQPPKKINYDINSINYKPIECLVDGFPKPAVEWYRLDGNEIPIERTTITSTGAMYFKQIRFSDAGRYVCFASNRYGSISYEFDINVTRKKTRVTVDPYTFLVNSFLVSIVQFSWLNYFSFISAIHGITAKTFDALHLLVCSFASKRFI